MVTDRTDLAIRNEPGVPVKPTHPGQIREIKEISHRRRRLQRGGFLRLGEPIKGRSHPRKIDHFRPDIDDPALLEAFVKEYGPTPRAIPCVFPDSDPTVVAPYAFRRYKGPKKRNPNVKPTGILYCKGDGEYATRRSDTDPSWSTVICPEPKNCEWSHGHCQRSMFLSVLPYELPTWLVLQINTTSINSIENILSGLAALIATRGRIDLVPFMLKLIPTPTRFWSDENKGWMKSNAHVLQIDITESLPEFVEKKIFVAEGVELEVPDEAVEDNPAPDLYPEEMTEDNGGDRGGKPGIAAGGEKTATEDKVTESKTVPAESEAPETEVEFRETTDQKGWPDIDDGAGPGEPMPEDEPPPLDDEDAPEQTNAGRYTFR